jgi:hypothetical protein
MAKTTKDSAEPRVVALAQQLGSVLGRAQAKADKLMKQVSKSTAGVKKSAAKAVAAVKAKAAKKQPSKLAPTKRQGKAGAKSRSGGTVDAPGKKHRQPPPQEKFSRGMTEPKVQQMGQKGIKGRMQRGRSGS